SSSASRRRRGRAPRRRRSRTALEKRPYGAQTDRIPARATANDALRPERKTRSGLRGGRTNDPSPASDTRRAALPPSALRSRNSLLRSAQRFSKNEKLYSAADIQLDAGDVGGEVGAEEGDRVRDLLRLAGPPERRAGDDPLVHDGIRHAEGLGGDYAGHDRVAGDPVPGALHREGAGEAEEACLRR